MTFTVIDYAVDGAIATITMNRPEMANAQSSEMIDEIDAAFSLAGDDDAVRVVILAGAGKHFSSGHDLKAIVGQAEPDKWVKMRETPEGKFRHEKIMYFERCLSIRNFRKPTIARVQGSCIAAGLMLASMCDLILASTDATFSNPVLKMSGAAVELLIEPWEFGIRRAKEFLFLGEILNAEEAKDYGLVNRVFPRENLESETRAIADRIALVPPITAEIVKDSLNHTADLMGQRDALHYHFMAHHFVHNTATALTSLAQRKTKTSMKEVLEDRDRGDVPSA